MDETGIGRHPGDSEKANARIAQELADRIGIDTAGWEIGSAANFNARTADERQVGELIGDVVVASSDDDIARTEVEGGKSLRKGDRSVLDDGDVVGLGAENARDGGVRFVHGGSSLVRAFVPAEVRLALEMCNDGLEDGAGHQGGAGVVEVNAVLAPGGLFTPLCEFLFHAAFLSGVQNGLGCRVLSVPLT